MQSSSFSLHMTMRSLVVRFTAALALVAPAAFAQPTGPQLNAALPPVRTLGKTIASSTELLGAVSQVRALPDGRVLVNDNAGRKVALFDKSLQTFTIVADTTSATANAYSSRAAGLIQYKGDSTLFVDPQSLSMLVIDGKGNVTRVMSVPRPNEAGSLIGGPNGTPGFDAQGRLVYRAPPDMQRMMRQAAGAAQPGQPGFTMPQLPDSMTIVRIDLESRRVDTVGAVKIPRNRMTMSGTPETGMRVSNVQNPLQYVDDWAVTADGRVVIVRGQEYKIEWIGADGRVEGSSKLPFAWRQLNDSMKVAFLDSTKTAMEKLREQAQQRMQQQGAGGGAPVVMGPGGGAAPPMMGERMVMEFSVRGGGDMGGRGVAPGAAANAPGRGGNQTFQIPPIELVAPNELPDYAPPFTGGAVRGDADGNVWIRTTLAYNGGAVYDIVNSKGQLTDRVLVPTGRFIAGFGPGIVYMGFRDGAGVRLEAAAVREGSTIAAQKQ
jgi:hypothetical protein